MKASDERCEGGVPIVLACDSSYAMPLATLLRSIVDSNTALLPLEFYVLSNGIGQEVCDKVEDSLPVGSALIRWVPVELDSFRQISIAHSHLSKMTYARLLIDRVLPLELKKILYLDVDILVLGCLDELFRMDLQDCVIGAARDAIDSYIKRHDSDFSGVPRVQDYFNAGVLLVNLELWRENRISERTLEYLIRNPQTPYEDQDGLNAACDGLWKEIDSQWNFCEHQWVDLSDLSVEERPKIVHFVTWEKPWKAFAMGRNRSFYDEFRSKTLYARTLGDRLKDMAFYAWGATRGVLRRVAILRSARDFMRSIHELVRRRKEVVK